MEVSGGPAGLSGCGGSWVGEAATVGWAATSSIRGIDPRGVLSLSRHPVIFQDGKLSLCRHPVIFTDGKIFFHPRPCVVGWGRLVCLRSCHVIDPRDRSVCCASSLPS